MHTKRIIPCLDVNNGRVVKGVNFVSLRDAGDPVEVAAAYDKAGADELVFLDITATSDGRNTTVDLVRRVAAKVFIPFTCWIFPAFSGHRIVFCGDWGRASTSRKPSFPLSQK